MSFDDGFVLGVLFADATFFLSWLVVRWINRHD